MLSNTSNFFKNLLINKPATWFSEFVYIRYIILISRLLNSNSHLKISNYKLFSSKSFSNFKIHAITTKNKNIYFQSGIRISRFMKGFNHAGRRMWDRYQVDKLLNGEVPSNIIDVGANIGEFSLYASNKYGENIKIIAIEPDPIALECIKNNLHNSGIIINERALSDKPGKRKFYLKTESADSSFYQPNGSSQTYEVLVSTLNVVFDENNLTGSTLLKIDAEGHEPEVLLGGEKVLEDIKWITIDAGPERLGETTINQVVEILSRNDFSSINVLASNIVIAKRT